MSHNPLGDLWEEIPFSFKFPYFIVWFLSPDGRLDGYMLNHGSFWPANEQTVWLRIPFINRSNPVNLSR